MKKMQSPHRILVVDDEEKIRKSLSGLLQDNGYEVVIAGSGPECLQILSLQNIDLVILDIVMPEMNGIEVIEKIKKKYRETEVIMLSGQADKEKAIAALRLNAYDLIEKPFESREMLNTIAHCLTQLSLRKEIERKSRELKESEGRYRTIFDGAQDGIILVDIKMGRIIDCNPEFEKQTGRKLEQLKRMRIRDLMPQEKGWAEKRFFEMKENGISGYAELEFQKPDGEVVPVEFVSKVMKIRGKPCIQSITRDITERKKAEEHIRYLSFHDKLTGLYNRAFFEEEIRRLDAERQLPLSLTMADVNGLKLVNDAFGHQEGDKLLAKIAQILRDFCRKEDIVARWGGDEFAIILPGTGENAAIEACDRIRKACGEADDEPIQPSIALGVATKEKVTQDIQQVVREAEARMYRNKLVAGESARSSIIFSLEKKLIERNYEPEEHIQRLRQVAMQIGYTIRLSNGEMEELSRLASLHDIGKLAIKDGIVLKQGSLSAEEWEAIKKHPETGYRIAQSSNSTASIAKAILTHHERWDGGGYPLGLRGNEILLISRIFSVLDAYDVMTHDRLYRKAISHGKALDELRRCSGTQFDPELVEIFTEMLSRPVQI